MAKVTELEELRLNFNYCVKVTDKALAELGKSVSKHPRLKKFELFVQGCVKVDETPIQFGHFLTDLCKSPNITHLGLNLSETGIGNGTLFTICHNLAKMTNLVHLSLKFNRTLKKLTITASVKSVLY